MSRSRSETESDEAEEESSPGVLDEKMATALAITDDQWFDSLEATEKDYILQNPIDPISTDLKCTSCSSRPRLNFQVGILWSLINHDFSTFGSFWILSMMLVEKQISA